MEFVYLSGEQLQVGWVNWRGLSGNSATFVLKQEFLLENGQGACAQRDDEAPARPSGDKLRDENEQGGLYYASDFAPLKPRADVLLHATARQPGGIAAPSLDVLIRVGDLKKSLSVVGDRGWEWSVLAGDKPGEPQPFTQMPINYENAYGGNGWDSNPLGKGRGREAKFLPNIEYPDQPIRRRSDNVEPAGFGPIDPKWRQRRSLVGTYDDKWLEERWPWFPGDFDFGFFNAAPRDQQIEGYLRGDEMIEFENLHPEHPVYRSRLPGLGGRCFLYEKSENGRSAFREVPLVLDTLWIDLDVERLVLVWRGHVPVRSVKLSEVERVVVATEPLSDPRPIEHYHQAMYDYLAEEDAAFEVEIPDDDEADAVTEREFEETEAEFASIQKEFDDLDIEFAQQEAEIRESLIARGVDPSVLDQKAAESLISETLRAELLPISELHSEVASLLPLVDELLEAENEAEQFDADFEAAEMEFADAPAWTRERVVQSYDAGDPISEADLDEIDLSGLAVPGAVFSRSSMQNAVLKGTDLSGANLTGVDLTGSDLSGANLSGAILDDADLSDAVLVGAVLTDLSLDGADFSGLDLKDLDFTNARGKYTEFSGADLTGAKFTSAAFDGADFDKGKLETADFRQAILSGCDFSEAQATSAVFEGGDLTNIRCEKANLTGANLRRVQAVGSVWEQAVLDNADLSGGVFKGSEFSETSAKAAIFDRADCSECSFEEAQLEGAKFIRCNLLRASFARAELRLADFHAANCYEADFFEAAVDDSRFQSTNLKQTLLAGRSRG